MGSQHADLVGNENHAITANQNATGAPYTDITARDADSDFHGAVANVNKAVRVEDADGLGNVGFFILVAVTPIWVEITNTANDTFIEHADTFATFTGQAAKVLQVNAGETAVEVGQNLTTAGDPSFNQVIITEGEAGVSLSLGGTTSALLLNRLTTTQRNAITPSEGMILGNTSTNNAEYYNGTSWITMISTGDVLKVGTPVDNQIGVWTGDGTLEGDADLTFDGSVLTCTNQIVAQSSGAGPNAAFLASSSQPVYAWQDTDAPVDEKLWDIVAVDGQLQFKATNDAITLADVWLRVDRTAQVVDSINFAATATTISGTLTVGGNSVVTKVGTPIDNQIGVWTGDGTIEGTNALVFDGTNLGIGIASPSTLLHLQGGTESEQMMIRSASTTENAGFTLGNSTGVWEIQFRTNPSSGWFEIASTTGVIQHRWFADDQLLASTGVLYWSSESDFSTDGVGAADVNLFRDSANVLRTNDSFIVDGSLTVGGNGVVTKVGTPVDNQVGVWTGDGTLEGTSSLTFDGSDILVQAASGAAVIVNNTTGKSMALTAGVNASSFIYDDSGAFSIQARTSAQVLAGSPDQNDSTLFIDTSENVGIGNISPNARLHVTGDTHVTGKVLSGDGTELLPSYSFISDPDTGMRRVSADVLGFSAKGFDVLQLTADASAANFLTINAGEDIFDEGLVLLTTAGVSSDRPLLLKGGNGSGVYINADSADGSVLVGRSSSGNGLAIFEINGAIALGGYTSASNANGRVIQTRADGSLFTQTELRISSPDTSTDFDIRVENEVTVSSSSYGVTGPSTFTRTAGSFITDGFTVGSDIVTAGHSNAPNNGTFTPAVVTALTLEVTATTLITESAVGGETMKELNTGDVTFITTNEELIFNTVAGEAARFTSLDMGIGTPLPTERLHVASTVAGTPNVIRNEHTISANADVTQGIHLFKNLNGSTFGWQIDSSGLLTGDGALRFISKDSGSSFTRLTMMRGTGFIGIGDLTPASLLHAQSSAADTTAIITTESTGTNGGISKTFVGDRVAEGNITGLPGDLHVRVNAALSELSLLKRVGSGNTGWRQFMTHTTNIVDIYDTSDWGTLELAPDGEMRVKLANATTYKIHADHTIPLMWMPEIPTPEQFAIIDFRFVNSSILLFCEAGDTAGAPAQIWGRNMGALLVQEGNFVDTANSEAGLVTTLFDLVGVDANSLLALQFTLIFGFKACGQTVDVFHDHTDSLFQDNVGGFVVRQTSAVASDNLVRAVTFRHSVGVAFDKPVYSFMGSPNTNQIVNSTIDLLPNQDFICLDSALASATEIVANPYPGPAKGDFFSVSTPIAITTQAADDTAFASVVAGAAGFSVIQFSTIQDFTRGQTVLIDGDTGSTYDGLQVITAVSDDQKEFTINVTFIATDSGNFRMVKHTVASHPFVRDSTIVITDTTNNGTFQLLRETDTSFNTPALFAAGDLVGTATSNPLNESDVGVKTLSNGAQRDSVAVGAMMAIANSAATTIATINTWTDLNLNALAAESSNNSRYTLTNTTTGELRYDDVNPIGSTLTASISAASTGGSQEFEFRAVVNGSPTVDAVVASVEVGSDTIAIPLEVPLSLVQNDLVRIQVQNIDGTSDITIKNVTSQIKI